MTRFLDFTKVELAELHSNSAAGGWTVRNEVTSRTPAKIDPKSVFVAEAIGAEFTKLTIGEFEGIEIIVEGNIEDVIKRIDPNFPEKEA